MRKISFADSGANICEAIITTGTVIVKYGIFERSLQLLAMLTESGDFADLSTIQPMLETLYSSFVSDFNNLVDIAKIYTGYNISKYGSY